MTSQAIGDRLCPRGHRNPNSNRYCQYCGDKMPLPEPSEPQIIGDRYRIVREIGRGGFGHTYLAEDTNRFNETCVIKEFAPELEHPESLYKAKELFSREAEVLYRLQHPQIPRFREWFMDDKLHSLFLAQDYVIGPTYFALLQQRNAQGLGFSEEEVLKFLRESLPILDYIHAQGVIHRDISPDNLICRQDDQRPILIDFGGVKQVTITLGSWKTPSDKGKQNITLIGKPAYAPEEQIRLGQVNPSSDIYALGVTALSLLMGKEPQEFFDSYQHRFHWRGAVNIQPHFAMVLDKMTAPRASDRYRSAEQVLADLPYSPDPSTAEPPKTPQTILVSPANSGPKTPLVHPDARPAPEYPSHPNDLSPSSPQGPAHTPNPTAVATPQFPPKPGVIQGIQRAVILGVMGLLKAALILAGLLGLGALGWWIVQSRLTTLTDPSSSNPPAENDSPSAQITPAERERRQLILERVANLNIPDSYFNRVTNEAYYLKFPNQQGRLLNGTSPEDEVFRAQWYDVAQQILDFSNKLSDRTRSRLGQYEQKDLDRITQELDRKNIDPQDFLGDVEQELLSELPMYRNQNLSRQQVNQLRLALASEKAPPP
jgi:serine/threonine protein kinase, bacterial